MNIKIREKKKAISLRQKGFTYNEILKEIPVAKSTLSLWLRSVRLATPQKQRISLRRKQARLRGVAAIKTRRLLRTKRIIEAAKKDVENLNLKDLWSVGTALYWAEGTKQKENNISNCVDFGNSDPKMIKLFIQYLNKCLKVKKDRIVVRLYIHQTADERKAKQFWSKNLNIPISRFKNTVFKKHNPKTNRRFSNDSYYGLLALRVKHSTDLNRKISGWIEGIVEELI